MNLKGSEIIIEELVRQGVDTVFGYPGGYVLDIYDELYKNSSRIRHILPAAEQGGAFAADAYARVSGKTGVVIATGGPGATNLITPIACAYLDSVPVVYITGNVAVPMLGQDSFQDIDIAGVTMPIVKHSYVIKDIRDLGHSIREAFRIAGTGRHGPVHIDIPKDVQLAGCDYCPSMPEDYSLPGISPIKTENMPIQDKEAAYDAAIELIMGSKKPFIYCGGGVTATGTGESVIALADILEAPIGTSLMGIGAVSRSFNMNLGMCGMHGRRAAVRAINEADLIIAAGVRFSDRATGSAEKYAQGTSVIHLDIDEAEIGKNIYADTSICADLRETLPALLGKLKGKKMKNKDAWRQRVSTLIMEDKEQCRDNNSFTPDNIISLVNNRFGDSAVVATDVGQHQMWVAQHYKFQKPRTLVTSGGLGAMGYGLGAAIGACLARGGKRTLLFTGDGSFAMNLNELSTAVTQKLPITIILFNNGALGMVRQLQTQNFEKRYSCTTLSRNTDFPKLAEAFGAEGCRAATLEQLGYALSNLPEDKPLLIDCKIDIDEKVETFV